MFYYFHQLAAATWLAMLYGCCCKLLFDKGKESAKDEAASPALVNASCSMCSRVGETRFLRVCLQ